MTRSLAAAAGLDGSPSAMLVMNAADYDGDDASYHDVWRLPFVVLDDGREIGWSSLVQGCAGRH